MRRYMQHLYDFCYPPTSLLSIDSPKKIVTQICVPGKLTTHRQLSQGTSELVDLHCVLVFGPFDLFHLVG
jgi:hypothetical protein